MDIVTAETPISSTPDESAAEQAQIATQQAADQAADQLRLRTIFGIYVSTPAFFNMLWQWSGCWQWQGAVAPATKNDKGGWGVIRISGKKLRAHRVAYEIFRGPIPAGHIVWHTHKQCPASCVNPAHLRMGNHVERSIHARRKLHLSG